MKKYWKLSTAILASSMLLNGGGGYLLTNRSTSQTNNHASLNEFSKDQQSDNVQTINNIEFTDPEAGPGNFAIARDVVNGDRVYGWGLNVQGQLGVGDTNNKTVPTQVVGLPDNSHIKWIKSGREFTLIVLADNSIWATGINNYGQFGNGSMSWTDVTTFAYIRTFKNEILDIDVGNYHAAVVTTNDAGENVVYSWGRNNSGQLGIGGTDDQPTPSEVKTLTGKHLGKLKFSSNSSFISILGIDNTIESICAWGLNTSWELGIEDKINKDVPILITYSFSGKLTGYYPGDTRIFFTTYDSTTSENYTYVSGKSYYNGLGAGSGITSCSITQVLGVPNSVEVANIYIYTMGTFLLTSTGKVYSCGHIYLSVHQIEDSSFHETEIQGATNFYGSVYSLTDNVLVLINNQLFAWGWNDFGQFGNGSTTNYLTPTLVDPFSTPSSLVQTKHYDTNNTDEIAKAIYSDSNVFNETAFKSYIDLTKFPSDWYWKAKMLHFSGKIWKGKMLQIYN